eukprot:TRINITY_DN951_c0_g1_i1.p1 TRINITY_DN951_c0_g1~~TRINITY_DN951_c0_g1_i1.p1  ORF type:complete len:442 (+),score=76.06 TRINITY_DN951_c0_g1_i1:140-1327(+)
MSSAILNGSLLQILQSSSSSVGSATDSHPSTPSLSLPASPQLDPADASFDVVHQPTSLFLNGTNGFPGGLPSPPVDDLLECWDRPSGAEAGASAGVSRLQHYVKQLVDPQEDSREEVVNRVVGSPANGSNNRRASQKKGETHRGPLVQVATPEAPFAASQPTPPAVSPTAGRTTVVSQAQRAQRASRRTPFDVKASIVIDEGDRRARPMMWQAGPPQAATPHLIVIDDPADWTDAPHPAPAPRDPPPSAPGTSVPPLGSLQPLAPRPVPPPTIPHAVISPHRPPHVLLPGAPPPSAFPVGVLGDPPLFPLASAVPRTGPLSPTPPKGGMAPFPRPMGSNKVFLPHTPHAAAAVECSPPNGAAETGEGETPEPAEAREATEAEDDAQPSKRLRTDD